MEDIRPTIGDSSWFTKDRFGLFIHWGLYSLAARHEWVMQKEQIPVDIYERYFKYFDPDLYDPKAWAKLASDAGMKYFVITTKHHEGFCLWDSQYTDYKATNAPAKRDLLTPMVEAFREQDMKVGFYHSLIDWHHPDFTIDDYHPMRNHPDREKLNQTRNQANYAKYLHNQVRELLTQFGKVDVMWFDFSYPPGSHGRPMDFIGKGHKDWGSEDLYKMIRELQPDVLLDDRLDLPYGWDFLSPEQFQPRNRLTFEGQNVVWEACQTFSGSWGYSRDEESWKSVEQLLTMLIDTVSKDGNLLLNVGPTARGQFDYRAIDRLEGIGEWMKLHSRSIYGCTQAPKEFTTPQDCRLTYNPDTKRLYIHVINWPFQYIHIDGCGEQMAYAQLLNDASEVKMLRWNDLPGYQENQRVECKAKNTLILELPIKKPNATIPVIEVFLK